MTNKVPPRIKGVLKTRFLEVKSNVFVGTMKNNLVLKIINYLEEHLPSDSGLLIITADNNCQGFKIYHVGKYITKDEVIMSGLYFVKNN